MQRLMIRLEECRPSKSSDTDGDVAARAGDRGCNAGGTSVSTRALAACTVDCGGAVAFGGEAGASLDVAPASAASAAAHASAASARAFQ